MLLMSSSPAVTSRELGGYQRKALAESARLIAQLPACFLDDEPGLWRPGSRLTKLRGVCFMNQRLVEPKVIGRAQGDFIRGHHLRSAHVEDSQCFLAGGQPAAYGEIFRQRGCPPLVVHHPDGFSFFQALLDPQNNV